MMEPAEKGAAVEHSRLKKVGKVLGKERSHAGSCCVHSGGTHTTPSSQGKE